MVRREDPVQLNYYSIIYLRGDQDSCFGVKAFKKVTKAD